MKTSQTPNFSFLILMLGLLLCFGVIPATYAAQGGNGNGGGNGNSGDGPDKGDLYGDAVYLLRNPDTGVPELINGCIRPLSGPGGAVLAVNADYPSDGYQPEDDPQSIEGWYACDPQVLEFDKTSQKTAVAADDDADDELEACDVITRCLDYVMEADLGRLSILKSPDRVLDSQLEEAIDKLENGNVTLDASGRPVAGGESFDSPLLNLALFREFHLWGAIYKDPLSDGDPGLVYDPGEDFILAAAFGLGAGDDKEDPGIDLEIAVRTAGIIDLGGQIHDLFATGDAVLPDSHEFTYEGKTRYFVNYSDFTYSRASTFPGNVCYDYFDVDQGKYVRAYGPIIDAVFGGDSVLYPEAVQLTGFALAANDARRVLVFAHDNLIQFIDSVFETTPVTLDNCPELN